MNRQPLPQRRRNFSREIVHDGRVLHVSIGLDDHGHIGEVFATGPKEGSHMAHMLADACVIISLALQYGTPPLALGKSLGTVPVYRYGNPHNEPASVIGAIVAVLVDEARAMEREPE